MDLATHSEDTSEIITNSVKGINYVRPPNLDFQVIDDNKNFTEYLIITDKNSKKTEGDNPFTNHINSFIFCNETITIKVPKKEYMIKNGKKRFAYAIGMFPRPKDKVPAYLDGCILAALGLKRQNTNADVICFITHDISKKRPSKNELSDYEKLDVVFDKVMYVPYISPYDMGGKGDLKTILLDKDLFNNCPNYTQNHPYVHVFFKLHIFNPDLFPYEKVCFVDSDLVPLNYYDSLFMLDCPAGFVEYRKKFPYLEAFHWDRCDFLEHGKKIPKPLTDIDRPTGADVNAGLLLVKPNKKEYDSMIKELTSPLNTWMGPDKYHKGFYSFNFNSPTGMEFVENSYCYPEQNYLTKRYSGKWKFIEFAFQSWALDPCNSFGIHMAAFNPKPWFKQPVGINLNIQEEYQPYLKEENRMPIAIEEKSNQSYENISYSYEIFNEVIIWGLINFPELKDYFLHKTEIHGTKISFDRDDFKNLSPKKNIKFKLLKDITKKDPIYKKLSPSQKLISDLINDHENTVKKVKDNYPHTCKQKTTDRYGKTRYDFQIVNYPNYKDKVYNQKMKLLKKNKMPFGNNKGKSIKNLSKKYVQALRKNPNFKNDPDLMEKINKFHKLSSKSGGDGRKRKKTQKKKYICYTGIGTKRDGTLEEKEFLKLVKKTFKGDKKKIKKLQDWIDYVGAVPGKCKPKFYYFSMGKNEQGKDLCKYCEIFDPVWNKLEKKLKSRIDFIKYDSNTMPKSFNQKFDIQGYPTLIFVPLHDLSKKGKHIHYKNENKRNEKELTQFLLENLPTNKD